MSSQPATGSPAIPSEWAARYGGWIGASLIFLLFYWRGLDCWFYQDDWGWLHINFDRIYRHVLPMLFAPKAHGNIRPWSENLYFYGLFHLFGLNALPFRLVVFATVIADLFLLDRLVRKLTGSKLAAFGAQIFWMMNAAVAPSFCWTCIYNETQYLFFLLLALVLFIDGRYWWQLAVFVVGLGSLETMVMYPCVASLYALIYDRSKLRRTIPLYAISAAFTIVHFLAAPAAKGGPYALQIDGRIPATLAKYIEMALGPERLGHFEWTWPVWIFPLATGLLCIGLLVDIVAARRAALFGAGLFVLLLVPLLPLPTHILDYLLTGPVMGLAIILAAALASRWRVVAAITAGLYLLTSIPAAWRVTTWNYERSGISRALVEGVAGYNREHPGKQILLTGMDTDQFFAGFADDPFLVLGMDSVHLAPGASAAIEDGGRMGPQYLLPPGLAQTLIDKGQALVLDVSGGKIHDVTAKFFSR